MIKKKYIVSGTYEEYNEFVYKRRNENNISYVYVQHAMQLVGLSNIEGYYIGTYFKRPDIEEIKQRIALSKLRSANDIEISYTNEYRVEMYKPAEDSVYGNVSGYIVEPVKQLDNNHVVDYRVNRLFSG
jgi:hypothetical protein